MLPFVWLGNKFGLDFTRVTDEFAFQNLLSAITCALIFIVLFFVSRISLGAALSLVIALITTLGTGFVSTGGTTLWSHNLESLFVLTSLLFIFKLNDTSEAGLSSVKFWHPYALGILLFAAFLCRPTAVTFVACTLIYLVIWHRTYFIKTATIAFLLLIGWLFLNLLEYGQLLAPYYSISRLQPSNSPLLMIFYGQLFSPSRGIFVFSPFLLFVLGVILFDFRMFRRNRLIYFSLIWFILHVVTISIGNNVPWWGGQSFGPRLLIDVIPAFFIMSVLLFKRLQDYPYRPEKRNYALLSYIILGGIGIFINSFQGLYNGNTARWNGTLLPPDPGIHNEWLFNWQYPQFTASKNSLCKRHQEFMRAELNNLEKNFSTHKFGEAISYQADDQNALFIGWSKPQSGWRWTECADVEVVFGPVESTTSPTLKLDLRISSLTKQTITVKINGMVIGYIEISEPGMQPQLFQISLDSSLLNKTDTNKISLHVPSVKSWIGDPHVLGLRFAELKITPFTAAGSSAPTAVRQ